MVSVKRSVSDISLDKNLSMSSPDLFTTGIREKSLPNGPNGRMWVANKSLKWCWHWPQLFTLPALVRTQLKLILEQSYEKNKKNKRKKVFKKYEII